MDLPIEVNGNSNKKDANNVQIGSHKNQSDGGHSSQQPAEPPSPDAVKRSENVSGSDGAASNGQHSADKSVDFKLKLKELRLAGQQLRSDVDQPDLNDKPAWFEEDLFENAKSVYGRHFMGVNFAHLSGLLLLVRVNSVYRTLSSTGKSDSVAKLFHRYYQTVIHVKRWYEGDIFEENSEAQRSLLLVRGMHNSVAKNLNDTPKVVVSLAEPLSGNDDQSHPATNGNGVPSTTDESSKLMAEDETDSLNEHERVHISEYDILLTQFAFIGFIVTRAKYVGLIDDFTKHDLESMLHFWRVIGYYLGASDRFNLCSRELDEVTGMCEAIMEVEFKRSIVKNPVASAPGIMGVNIVRSIKFIPMLTIYGITKYLYELIDIDTTELEERATRYSRLSYTLIKLVMSRLLAYRGFRWFNNGLTRLSVYLVGKMDETFANHLTSKYGQELKL